MSGGWAGAHRAATHCPRGHAYDAANTVRRKDTGARICRACRAEHSRAWRLRKKKETR